MKSKSMSDKGQRVNMRVNMHRFAFPFLLLAIGILNAIMLTSTTLNAVAQTDPDLDAVAPTASLDIDADITIRILHPPQWDFDSVGPFENGLADVFKDGKVGCIDKAGKIVVPLEYDTIGAFQRGFAKVGVGDYGNRKFGFVYKDGTVAIPVLYDEVWRYSREGLVCVAKDGKQGFVDMAGNIIVPIEYDDATYFTYGLSDALIKVKNAKSDDGDSEGSEGIEGSDGSEDSVNYEYGLFDTAGNVILPVVYNSISEFSKGLAVTHMGDWGTGNYGICNEAGEVVPLPDYDRVYRFSEGLAEVEKDGKYGFIDKIGTIVVPLEYDYAFEYWNYNPGVALVGNYIDDIRQYGVIDKTGKVIIPLEYDRIYISSDNALARVEKGGEVVLFDFNLGRAILPDEYEITADFSEGLAYVYVSDGLDDWRHGGYGYIDETGAFVILPQYQEAHSFEHGLAKVKKDWRYGLIDRTGRVVVPFEYSEIQIFSEELAIVSKNASGNDRNGYGLVSTTTGATIVPPEYDDIWIDIDDGLVRVEKDNKFGYFDISGDIVAPVIYDYLHYYNNGFVRFTDYGKDKDGYIDTAGNVVVPAIYDGIGEFYNGMAWVRNDGKYGYVDSNGNVVVPPIYDSAENFYGRLAEVRKDGKTWYIDKTGAEFLPEYEDFFLWATDPEWAWVKANGKWGLIDGTGTYVVPPSYDYFENVYLASNNSPLKGFVRVAKDGKWGICNGVGIEVVPTEYGPIFYADEDMIWIERDGEYGLLEIVRPPYVNPYADVKEHDWFYDDVLYVSEKGLLDGTQVDMFSPGNTVARETLAAILFRLAGSPKVSLSSRDMLYYQFYGLSTESGAPFEDVKGGEHNRAAVDWVAKNGIMHGYRQGVFGPEDDVTRQELVVTLARYADIYEMELQSIREYAGFSDESQISDEAVKSVKLFFQAGVINGKTDGSMDPQGAATRAELAATLCRLLKR